ncbi:MAG: hypothetical protein PHU12_00840 [Candidatus Aenigmarchaeota archaeon]|nr:hypothetical protein [Candidatus Aenigmarchaeota archaeon]
MIPNGIRPDVIVLKYIETVESRKKCSATKDEILTDLDDTRTENAIRCLVRNKEIENETVPRKGVCSRYHLTEYGRNGLKLYAKCNVDEMRRIGEFLEQYFKE